MTKNLIAINVDLRESRVALIEDGIIAELHLERASTRSTLGNIVLGKVTRVLPGLQAAFIDIGQERAAFLHVEDLIRPDDFDEYLAGGRKLARGEETAPPEGDVEIDEEEEIVGEATAAVGQATQAAPDAPTVDARGEEGYSDSSHPPHESPSSQPPPYVRREPTDDLETTVSYPDWPLPPPSKLRDGERSQARPSNGSLSAEGAPPSGAE